MNLRVEECIQEVLNSGKKAKTVKQYSGAMGHWCDVSLSKGWDPFLDEETMKLRTQKFLWYFAYERSEHKLKARSIRSKRAAIRWMHLREQRGNPFAGLEAVDNFLSDMEKIDGPTEPKLPVPITVLQSILALLKTEPKYASDPLHYHHSCIKGALLTGFGSYSEVLNISQKMGVTSTQLAASSGQMLHLGSMERGFPFTE